MALLLGACAPSADPADALLEKAREAGAVRVIVTLDVPPIPAGRTLSEAELEARRRAITARKESLRVRMASYSCRFSESPEWSPVVVAELDAVALQVLRESPEVVSVTEDRPLRPSGPER